MKNNYDNLIDDIRSKYNSIADNNLKSIFLVFVCCAFAQAYIKYIYENRMVLYEKINYSEHIN